jgi:RNA polymerase sigma-54 factor
MQLGLRTVQKQIQTLKPTLQQLQYYRLLQQTNLELEEDIREEISQNPALEVEEVRRCPRCGEILLEGSPCITCMAGKADDSDRQETVSNETLDMLADIYSSSSGSYEASTYEAVPEDELPDAFASVVRAVTLEEYLKNRLAVDYPDFSDDDRLLAGEIIDSIDSGGAEEESEVDEVGRTAKNNHDNPGLITLTDAQLAHELGADLARVSMLRRRIAEIDPIGSGLRSSIDVLAMQAELAEDLEEHERTALALIIRLHLEDIRKERFAKVAKKVGVSAERTRQLVEYARRSFHVHPRRLFEESVSNAAVENTYITADVRIRELNGKFIVEILDSGLPQLKITKYYVDSYNKLRKDRSAFTTEERKHIREYFERASTYLTNLNSRRQTMLDITDEIVRQQEDFLRKGPLYLKKLTRKKVAETIGVHPSTVSRALAVRYCWLPDNSIVPFSLFFDPSLCYIEMIRQILKQETPSHVLSDEEIRDIMSEKGHVLSRRVITKYRMKGKIPPSGRRKRLLVKEMLKRGMISEEEVGEDIEDEDDETLLDDIDVDVAVDEDEEIQLVDETEVEFNS